jgi:uncharacterized protein (TIRG00374 family)
VSWRRWLITLISFAAAIGVSVYLARQSWVEAGTIAALPLPGHLVAIVAMTAEVLARTVKLHLAAGAFGIPFDIPTSLRVNLGGDFGAGITPSRSGSEPTRFLILSEARMRPASAILLLFTEMFTEMVSVLILAVGLALLFSDSGGIVTGVLWVACGYSVFVLGLGYAGLALAKRASGPPPRWARAAGFNAGRWRRVQLGLRHLRDRVATVRQARRGLILGAMAFSLLHIVARLAVLPVLVASYDLEVPVGPLLLWPLALHYGGNATPAPAGGGLIEVAFQSALGGSIPARYFASTLIWWRFYTFYILLLLGAIVAGRTVMRALRGDVDDPRGDRELADGRRSAPS